MRGIITLAGALLVACGTSSTEFPTAMPDGPRHSEDETTAPTVDGGGHSGPRERGPVTLVVADRGVPVPGVRVWFMDPDSTLAVATETDADGIARGELVAGGFVTARTPFPSELEAWEPTPYAPNTFLTTAAVQPGDVIRYGNQAHPYVPDEGEVDVSIASDPGAADHEVHATCFGGGGSWSPSPDDRIRFRRSLLPGVTACDVLVISLAADGRWLNGFIAKAVPLVGSGPTKTLALDETYVALAQKTIAFTNVPSEIEAVELGYELYTERGILLRQAKHLVRPTSGVVGTTFAVPAGTYSFHAEGTMTTRTYQRRTFDAWGATCACPGQAGPVEPIDFRPLFLEGFIARPLVDAATRQVTWPVTVGESADVTELVIDGLRWHDAAQMEGTQWRHRIVGPYVGNHLRLPQLPVEDLDPNFRATDTTYVSKARAASVPGDYAAARTRALSGSSLEVPILDGSTGQTATVRFSAESLPY